jgi:hypothetical protein
LGPVLVTYGLGVALFGDFILGRKGKMASVLGWLFVIPGGIAGVLLFEWLHDGDLHFLESAREIFAPQNSASAREIVAQQSDASVREIVLAQQNGDIRNRLITRPELDAIVAEVGARAAELKMAQASLNPKDPAAVERFNKDVAAYTQRNHEAAALRAVFEVQQGR